MLPFVTARRGSALRFIAQLELSALAPERAATTERELLAIFDELTALPDDTLRGRARDAYRKLFDAELSQIVY